MRHASIAGLFVLAGWSVVGAFLGAERSAIFFQSIPLAVFWFALAAATLASIISFPRFIRSPGLLGMHLGWVLLIVGGMLGSRAGHRFAAWLGAPEKIPAGYMFIGQGEGEDTIHGDEHSEVRGTLPFTVQLRKFDVEYYPIERERWEFQYQVYRPDGGASLESVEWKLDKPVKIPGTDMTLRVRRFVERPGPWGPPVLRVTPRVATDKTADLTMLMPAVIGSGAVWPDPKIKFRVVRLFRNFQIAGKSPIDAPGDEENPAVELEVDLPDGRTIRHFAFTEDLTAGVDRDWGDGMDIVYLPDQPHPAKLAGQYRPCRLAAMVSVNRAGDSLTRWLIVRADDDRDAISLESLFADNPSWRAAGSPVLGLRGKTQAVRVYRSELSVIRDGREVAKKTVTVNDPLHYGGYHFYQMDHDTQRWEYTVLSVRSDSGLWVVYAGMTLLCAGAFVRFWLAPIAAGMRRRRGK